MSTHANALARPIAGLLGCLVATGAWAQQAEVKVGKVDTKVDVVTLQAGEAYGFDDAALSEDGKKLLDAVLGSLKDEYVYRVDVSGYTDRIGDEAYNVGLSGRRAQSAADHLVQGGIPAERIKILAMGSSDPIVDCGDEAGDELIACLAPNRRTEVRFFYPRASLEGMAVVKEQLSTAAGEYVAIYSTPARSTTSGTRAIEVFMEGCRADIDTYCDQVTPGEQRLLACIYAHEDKVSDKCKGNVRDALLLVKADIAQANFVGRLCGSDILAHCGDVEPGDGRVEACLADKGADLSQTCRQALANLPR
jgi:outer membrane protein OmpA-like peptidoglycan-associated protein